MFSQDISKIDLQERVCWGVKNARDLLDELNAHLFIAMLNSRKELFVDSDSFGNAFR